MKYCPSCSAEHYDDVSMCRDCDTPLISEQKWKKLAEKRGKEDLEVFVIVKTVESLFEADVIKDALEKDGIPVLLRTFSDTSFNGLYIPQKGWGNILVPAGCKLQAEKVIEEVQP